MFEVGFTEILLIFGIALLVLGPARLPKLAADVGRWAGRARSMARQLRTQLEQEVRFDPLADDAGKTASTHTIHSPAVPYYAPALEPSSPQLDSLNVNPPNPDADARALPAQVSDVSVTLPDTLPADTHPSKLMETGAQGSLLFPEAVMQSDKTTDDRKPV